jgi:hypothetical protein
VNRGLRVKKSPNNPLLLKRTQTQNTRPKRMRKYKARAIEKSTFIIKG